MYVLLVRNGVVEDCICADSVDRAKQFFPDFTCLERGDVGGPGWTYDGSSLAPPESVLFPKAPITRLQFLQRFTLDQSVAIRALRSTDTTIDYCLYMLDLADQVDLEDDATVRYVGYLQTLGLIAPDDAERILS